MYKFFYRKNNCPFCEEVLSYLDKEKRDYGKKLQLLDIETPEGLAELSYFGLLSVPYLLKVNINGKDDVIGGWIVSKTIIRELGNLWLEIQNTQKI